MMCPHFVGHMTPFISSDIFQLDSPPRVLNSFLMSSKYVKIIDSSSAMKSKKEVKFRENLHKENINIHINIYFSAAPLQFYNKLKIFFFNAFIFIIHIIFEGVENIPLAIPMSARIKSFIHISQTPRSYGLGSYG